MNELNLLLRHQIVERSDQLDQNYSPNGSRESYYEEEYSRSIVFPKNFNCDDRIAEEQSEELKMELAKVQLEESAALEPHNKLTETFNLLEMIIEHLINHIDCIILELKSADRLTTCLNSYSIHEQIVTDSISSTLKGLKTTHDLSTLEALKTKLLTIQNDDGLRTKKLHNEFRERRANYKLALKNFKIILEILNVNEDSLRKLKQQFDEVLMDYQHCRCILDHELPFILAERTKLLGDCLTMLAGEYDRLSGRRGKVRGLLQDIGRKVRDNEYILVRKESPSPRSSEHE